VTFKTAGVVLAGLAGLAVAASAASSQTRGLPVPMPPPTIYSAPTPAPLTPPINPGPAVVPPAGLSPLLTEPGPVYPIPGRQGVPYPALQLPGPVDQQKLRSYRNGLVDERRRLERSGVSPGSERSREVQQQLDQPGPR
jgi:hypothetical protein